MRVRLAAYGVILREGRILLAHWRAPGRGGWTLPGGGLEPGEDPVEGAVREIREETGYHARVDELLGIDSRIIPGRERISRPGEDLQAVRIVYAASILGGALRAEEDGTTDEAAWFPLAELGRLDALSLVETGLRLLAERPADGRLAAPETPEDSGTPN